MLRRIRARSPGQRGLASALAPVAARRSLRRQADSGAGYEAGVVATRREAGTARRVP